MKRRIGQFKPDEYGTEKDWMWAPNLLADEGRANCYGSCKEKAEEWQQELGGDIFKSTTGNHAILVKDDMIYDYVKHRGKKKPELMDEYFIDTPFEFEEI
jgi:hypothetical protein